MTFLKLIGSLIVKGLAIIEQFQPAVQAMVPNSTGVIQTVSKDLSEAFQVIVNVEAMGQLSGLSGADKAKAAGPLLAQIVLGSAAMAGKTIADPAAFQAAAVVTAGGFADMLNAVHGQVVSVPMTLTPAA